MYDPLEFAYLSGRANEMQARGIPVTGIANALKVCYRTAKQLVNGRTSQKAPKQSKKRNRVARVKRMATQLSRKGCRVEPRYPSARSIGKEIGASKSTVLRDLHASGLVPRVRKWSPSEDSMVQQNRLKFSRKHNTASDSKLKQIIFTDEHRVSTNYSGKRLQWVIKGRKPCRRERKNIRNAESFMIWGAIGFNYRKLVLLKAAPRPRFARGRPKRGEVRPAKEGSFKVNGKVYLEKCLKPLIEEVVAKRRKCCIQYDGARPHIEKNVMAFLRNSGIPFIDDWPSYSPMLNPIEQLWPHLNEKIAEYNPTTEQELEEATIKAWQCLPQKLLNNLVLSFRNKLEQNIATRGGE